MSSSRNTAGRRPGVAAHLVALSMPFTMTVLVPIWLLVRYEHASNLALQVAGLAIFLAGFSLFVATLRLFITVGHGTLAPWDPTKHLVVRGPYRYCRNPMISGVLAMIIGESLFFGSTAMGVWGAIFFAFNTMYFVLKEEPGLERVFGQEYREYRKHVPRWLPRVIPYKASKTSK